MTSTAIVYRRGTLADSRAAFEVFAYAIADLTARTNPGDEYGDPARLLAGWEKRRGLYEFLAEAAEFWVAERDGRVLGYARALYEDGIRELTEFFVLPEAQSAGVGRELLARAFSHAGERRRIIIATSDARAQARYLKSGVYPRTPLVYTYAQPRAVSVDTDLFWRPLTNRDLEAVNEIDHQVIDQRRPTVHAFLRRDREGWLYLRDGRPVGYGYWGESRSGPVALLDERDFPAVLAHGETLAAERGSDEFGVELPLVSRAAVHYLLGRGFRLDRFQASLMSDAPFGRLEHYLPTSPPFFL